MHRFTAGLSPRRAIALLLAACLPAAPAAAGGSILYVDDGAAPGGDGSSWPAALRFLSDALAIASVPANGITEVRVGQGLQRPDRSQATPLGSGDRNATYQLIDGVALRGGFGGVGALDPDAHNPALFLSTIGGDVFFNDLPGAGVFHPSLQDNIYHLVTAIGVGPTAILDGFTLTGGVATQGAPETTGGGLRGLNASPTIANCTFSANLAFGSGGGVSFQGASSPTITACAITDCQGSSGGGLSADGTSVAISDSSMHGCSSSSQGGGLYFTGGALIATGCTISGNSTDSNGGGGIYTSNTAVQLTDCTFVGNDGGGDGGGAYIDGFDQGATIVGCRFEGNSATDGGGLLSGVSAGAITISGTTFTANVAITRGGGVFHDSGPLSVDDCDFQVNQAGESGGGIWGRDIPFTNCTFAGNGAGQSGGACRTSDTSSFLGCTFLANEATDFAGALQLVGQNSRLVDCAFLGNTSNNGGAIEVSSSSILVANSVFSGNSANQSGGAIRATFTGMTLMLCTISRNNAAEGGGVQGSGGAVGALTNCILWGNTDSSGNIEAAQIGANSGSSHTVQYNCIEGWSGSLGGVGNFGADPLLVDADGPDDDPGTSDDDLHLLPGSPCINSGNNWGAPADLEDLDDDGDTSEHLPLDFAGQPRFTDGTARDGTGCGVPVIVDMGAHEAPGAAANPVQLGDLEGDGAVGIADLLMLLASWGPCGAGCCLADFNLSGSVGIGDLLTLLANWSTT